MADNGIGGGSEDDEEEEIVAAEPEPKRQKVVWEICGLDSRNYEREQLGAVSFDRTECFGCIQVGEKDKTAVRNDQINNIIDVIRKSVARCDPVALATQVSELYEEYRQDINANLINGDKPLPPWKPAMVLDHIRHHNTDPEMQTWLRLSEIQELQQVALRACVEMDHESGEKRLNHQQCRIYNDLAKLHQQLSRTDVTKCLFNGAEKHVDMSVARQPTITFHGKNIVDYMKQMSQ